jgi:hypothetical protein
MHRGTGINVHQQTFGDLQIGDTFFDADYGDMIWNGLHWQSNQLDPLKDPQVGDLVHYIPFEGCDVSKLENGIIKLVQNEKEMRVVYHCAGDWHEYFNYTSALTHIKQLNNGWIIKPNKEE